MGIRSSRIFLNISVPCFTAVPPPFFFAGFLGRWCAGVTFPGIGDLGVELTMGVLSGPVCSGFISVEASDGVLG
jgi:hypothetical protein